MDRKDLRMDGEKEIKGHDCKEIIGKMISEEGIGSAELGKRLGVSSSTQRRLSAEENMA